MSDARDTLLPPALPTETDNVKPEPDVMRVGKFVLRPHALTAGVYESVYSKPPLTMYVSVWPSWHADLCYKHPRFSLRAQVIGVSPEDAVLTACSLGNFPPEFFEALGKEIEP